MANGTVFAGSWDGRFRAIALATGNRDGARKRYSKALALRKAAYEAAPKDPEAARNLSVAYCKLGEVEEHSGHWAEAKGHYERDLEIATRLAQSDEENAKWQRDLFYTHTCLFRVSEQLADEAGWRFHIAAATAICEKLVAKAPDHPQYEVDLKYVQAELSRLGDAAGAA